MDPQISSTDKAPAAVSDRITLVYDKNGTIVHIHRVTQLEGGIARSADEIRRAALEHASRSRNKDAAANAKVLVVDAPTN